MPAQHDDVLRFKDEPPPSPAESQPWKLLIVDDEEEMHGVTRLALTDFRVHGRPLAFVHAYTGRDAVRIMHEQPDIAMILMDVVMETEHAGLEAVEAIRKQLGNARVRIVLRTGQPGQAPESEVVSKFDINDYKEKTELTTKKLYTVIHTGLSHYRELVALDRNRQGLHKVIEASARIFEEQALGRFAEGVLQQLAALLYSNGSSVMAHTTVSVAATRSPNGLVILAGTGAYAGAAGRPAREVVEAPVLEQLERALRDKRSWYTEHAFVGYFGSSSAENVLYLSSDALIAAADRALVELFCRNVAIAFQNLHAGAAR